MANKITIHPHYIILTLVIIAISTLFLGGIVSYIYVQFQAGANPIKLPYLFYINGTLLMITSYLYQCTYRYYSNDNTEKYKVCLHLIFVISLIFLFSQSYAWSILFSNEVFINSSNNASYLYFLSGLHFVHVIMGLPFLLNFIYDASLRLKHPVSVFIYLSDISKKRQLTLLTIYWHFLDLLWIILLIIFATNYYLFNF